MSTFVTRHALDRMAEMGVKRDELEAVMAAAEFSYPTRNGCVALVRGRLAVVVCDAATEAKVVTVLWHGAVGRAEGPVVGPPATAAWYDGAVPGNDGPVETEDK